MDKKLLSQYSDLKKEIPKLEKRIEKLERQSSMASDVVQNGYKRHAIIYGFDVIRSNKLQQLKDTLEIRKAKAIIQQIEIEKYVNTIEDSELRQIFEHRYIDGMDWYQVAAVMNMSGESVPRKRVERYLEKN